jgi:nanoRNase/pAp phosphatase (c-di-AMP/oligoRNAs hydrolase)
MSDETYRLVTRSDFDGLVCAMLLRQVGLITNDILFVHPKDMQDGKVEITGGDITTNLPYVEGVHLAFDHHHSEHIRVGAKPNYVCYPDAPSAARVVYDYYGGAEKFPGIAAEMMLAVDKADSAQFSREDILDPKGWDLLSFLMDARTGLGRFHDFRISNYQLMMECIDYCLTHGGEETLALPDVKERVDLYFGSQEKFIDQIKRCSTVHQNLVVLDLRNEETIWPGNRFMIYALHSECNISIHALWGKQKQNTVFAVGHSILNRSSRTDVGELMLSFAGGGHKAAGTCQVPNEKAGAVLAELIELINEDG